VRLASSDVVLLLDDDACLLDGSAVARAVRLIRRDPTVAAVAFAQANADGAPWPETMQPARAPYPCVVPAYIGFAHLVRRDVFLRLRGYRRTFFYHGEEKEYCLRLLDAGYRVVYLPDARVAHLPDPSGRSARDYIRYVIRNDCLTALYNDPWWRLVWTLPGRLVLYFRMRHGLRVTDPGGFVWVIRELVRLLPSVVPDRRPLDARTFRRWRELRAAPPYEAPGVAPLLGREPPVER